MNDYGIFGCVVLLLLVPAAACLNEYYVRRHTDPGGSDGIIQYRLPCDPDLQCPQDYARGVAPSAGSRSRRLGESREAVYLFKEREAAADGLANWLGDELPEDEPVALIVVDLPAGARILDTTADYELIFADRIPPENLTVMEFDWQHHLTVVF